MGSILKLVEPKIVYYNIFLSELGYILNDHLEYIVVFCQFRIYSNGFWSVYFGVKVVQLDVATACATFAHVSCMEKKTIVKIKTRI